jgi:hypothetical protein
MADGHFPTLVSATRDANATANPIFVQLTDGTDLALIDGSGNLNVAVNGSVTVTATDLDIRDLTHVSDSVKVGDGTDFLAIDASGNIGVTDAGGSLTVDAVNLDIRDLTHVTDSVKIGDGTDFLAVAADGSIAVTDNGGSLTVDGSVTVSATDLDIRDLTHVSDSVKIGDGTDFLAVAADGSIAVTDNGGSLTVDGTVTVTATDLDIRDLSHTQDSVKIGDGTDFLAVNADGSINVTATVIAGVGTKVHDHKTASAVASDTVDNHDVTASGGVLLINQVTFASSGGSKAQLIYDPTGVNKVIWTGFIPKEGGEKSFTLVQPFEAADTKVVRLAVTNRQGAAQDLYSTIEGLQQ